MITLTFPWWLIPVGISLFAVLLAVRAITNQRITSIDLLVVFAEIILLIAIAGSITVGHFL